MHLRFSAADLISPRYGFIHDERPLHPNSAEYSVYIYQKFKSHYAGFDGNGIFTNSLMRFAFCFSCLTKKQRGSDSLCRGHGKHRGS
jgi:hypothetical protein